MKIENNKYSEEELEEKIIIIFKCILIEFFHVIIHLREKKYFEFFVELIKYLIIQYEFCANYFLEEFSCFNNLMLYLVNCPNYSIKKVLVNLIYSSMISSEKYYTKEKREMVNSSNNKMNDEELAMELQEEYSDGINSVLTEKKCLEREFSTPYVLKVVYNVCFLIRSIKFWNHKNETNFLFEILLKFSLISQNNKELLVNDINLLFPLNVYIAKDCKQEQYINIENLSFDKGLFKSSHDILNPDKYEKILGDFDEIGKYRVFDCHLMLLCNLNYFQAKTKEEIIKLDKDLVYTFYNGEYIYRLLRYCKTKQGIRYLSKLIILKCSGNKEIFQILVDQLISILERIKDDDSSFFDESILLHNFYVYQNTEVRDKFNCYTITLKKNISYIFREIFIYSKNDPFCEYKIKTSLDKLFSFFTDNKCYYSRAITVINIIINLFESTEIDINKYSGKLNEIINWLNKYKIPPKYYEIKGINMYKDLIINYSAIQLSEEQKIIFEEKEILNTNIKIERIRKILLNEKIKIDITNFDLDLSDFKFTFGDIIIYNNKEYIVTQCLDDIIKIKLIEKNDYNEWANISKDNYLKRKNIPINEKEKKSFWIEIDNYKLRIKKLASISDK